MTKIPTFRPLQPQAEDPKAKLREAAQQYEEHFLNEMVKSMRKSIDRSQIMESNFAQDYYTEQLDQQYVKAWKDRGGIGLADIIYDQLNERFFERQNAPRPNGPIHIDQGTTIKIDETRPLGVPMAPAAGSVSDEVSFLYEWDQPRAGQDVSSPWAGRVQQAYRADEQRQLLKIEHDNGLVSTLSFIGEAIDLKSGDSVNAGEPLGRFAADARGLTWQVAKVEPYRRG